MPMKVLYHILAGPLQVITLLLASKEASLKYTQAWEMMGTVAYLL